jgi:predicted TIM-barrel fold metal-dependent hydrolase
MGIKNTNQPSARIDVHHHLLPQFYIEAQRAAGITGSAYKGFPIWSPESSITLMNQLEIEKAILSYTSPGFWFGNQDKTNALVKKANDYLFELKTTFGEKFGGFAAMPLPNIDATLSEISRALDELRLDGICLLTSVDDRYIGHPDFEALYKELDRRKAIVFIHPCYPPGTEATGWDIPRMLIDYPFETTRVATNLIMKGVITRYPNIRFILSHAGGTLPFLAHRLSIFDKRTPFSDNYPEGALTLIRKFWFDTALSANEIPLSGLREIADPTRILFGTDYPYVVEEVADLETQNLDSWAGSRSDRLNITDINHGNWKRLAGDFS